MLFRLETKPPCVYGDCDDSGIVIEPNSQIKFSLTSDDIYKVGVDLDTTSPTAGRFHDYKDAKFNNSRTIFAAFSAVSLGNGKYAIGFGNVRVDIYLSSNDIIYIIDNT